MPKPHWHKSWKLFRILALKTIRHWAVRSTGEGVSLITEEHLERATDVGNDLTRLHILREAFERKAVEAFGPHVTDLSDQLMTPATIPNGEHQLRPPR